MLHIRLHTSARKQTLAQKVKINHVRCFHVSLTPGQNFMATLINCLDQNLKDKDFCEWNENKGMKNCQDIVT